MYELKCVQFLWALERVQIPSFSVVSVKNLKQVYRGNELCISVSKGGGGLQQAALQRMLTQEKYIIEAHTDALCLKYLQILKNIIFWHYFIVNAPKWK